MAEHGNSPPITIASMRAIREKKRQLAVQPAPGPFELTHLSPDAQPPIKEEIEEAVGDSMHTHPGLEWVPVIKQEVAPPANPNEPTHSLLERRPVIKQEDEEEDGNTAEVGHNIERPTLYDGLVSAHDKPETRDIRSILAALHRISEPSDLSKTQAKKFRQKKQQGLDLLQEVMAQGRTEPGLPLTSYLTTSAAENAVKAEAEIVEELCKSSGTVTPAERARSLLLHPEDITMADVQALGQQVKHINKAQMKVSKLLETGETGQAGTKMHRWLENGVKKHLQLLHAQAPQFGPGRPLESKPDQEASGSALRGVVLGKRSATPSQPFHNRGYTERFPPESNSEIGNSVAEDADPALIAMWKIVPELQKDAMLDIETQIVFPTVAEYLNVVKRRKLGTFATEHDTSINSRPQQSHDDAVSRVLPGPSASSSSLTNLRIEGFLMGIRNGVMTEEKVPSQFSINAKTENGDTAVHGSVRTDAYATIFKALSALLLLDRDMTKVEESKANGPKGRWTCLFKKAMNEMCKWPAEGEAGQYACDYCMRRRRPCVIAIKGVFLVAPLAPSLRMGRGPGDREYCVLPERAVKVKPKFFS